MPFDENNFKIEFGVMKGTLQQVLDNQKRMDEKLDRVCESIPEHEERLSSLEKWRITWTKVFFGIIVGIVIASITAIFSLAK